MLDRNTFSPYTKQIRTRQLFRRPRRLLSWAWFVGCAPTHAQPSSARCLLSWAWVVGLGLLLAGCQTTQHNLQGYESLWGSQTPMPSPIRHDPPRPHKPHPRYLGSAQAYTAYLRGRLLAQDQHHHNAIKAFKIALVHDANSAFLHHTIAQQYTQLGEWVQAVFWARRAIEQQKNYAPAHHLLGRIYWIQRNQALAIASYKQAILSEPRYLAAYLDLEQLLSKADQAQPRKSLLESLIRHRPDAHQGFFLLAKIHQAAGDIERALQLFQEAVNRQPSHVEALYHMAQIYEKQKNTDAAIRCYLLLLDYQPEAWQARMELAARWLLRRAAFDAQRAAYQLRYVMREATQMESYERAFRIGVTLYEKQLFADAIAWLRRALRLHRQDFVGGMSAPQDKLYRAHAQNIRFYLGMAWRAEGQPQKALLTFRRLRPVSKNIRLETQAYQIELLAELGRYRESRESLKRFRPPKSSMRRWIRLSQAFAERASLEDLDAEIREFQERMKEAPAPEEGLMHLSYLLFKQGRYAPCEQELKKILAKNPRHAGALNFLGYLLAEQGIRLPEAEKLVATALQIEADNPSYLDSLGWVYVQMRQWAKAEEALHKASERLPRDPAVLAHLATLYQRTGRWQKALGVFRRARALRPEPSLQRKIESNIQALRRRLPKVDISRSSRRSQRPSSP